MANDNRQVYRYQAGASDPLQGCFIDVAGSMRQPPLPPAPEGDDPVAFSAWVDDHTSILFNDIAGCDEADMYVTGDETWHFDGKDWQAISLKLTDKTMHVIKIIDQERIAIAGDNGYLFMGNARTGFTNLSSVDDNQTITGLEWFNQRLFIASDTGLFVWDEAQQKIIPYSTGLVPELQDAHLLEAKDGVLWSFGYKDLAYLDTREGGSNWVRLHHPDNPRIGDTPVKKKRRRKSSDQAAEEAALVAGAQAETLALLPAAPGNNDQLDIGGLMARVGHVGVGDFIRTQLLAFGCKANNILKSNHNKRYPVSVPHQGVVWCCNTPATPSPLHPLNRKIGVWQS